MTLLTPAEGSAAAHKHLSISVSAALPRSFSTIRRQGASIATGIRIEVEATIGISLSAEIKTGKRRVIDYLLNPLRQHAGDAMRER